MPLNLATCAVHGLQHRTTCTLTIIIEDYEDPLLPRQHPPSYYYPKGVTQEMEARLANLIAEVKDSMN